MPEPRSQPNICLAPAADKQHPCCVKAVSAAFFLFSMLASRVNFLGFLAIGAAWLLNDHYRPWVNFHSEALALTGIGLLALGLCLRGGPHARSAPHLVRWLSAAALIPWAQFLFGISMFAGDALLGSLYVCALTAGVWVGYSYASTAREDGHGDALVPMFYVIWFVALASAAIGMLQWLNLQEGFGIYLLQTDINDRAMGNLGQPNQLATLLLMGIVSLAWTYDRQRLGGIGLAVGVAFLTLVLGMTQSRAGILSAVAIAVLFICKRRLFVARLKSGYVLAWILAYGGAINLLPLLREKLLLGGSRNLELGIDGARMTIWRQVLSGLRQAPWLGYGWNQTATANAIGSVEIPGTTVFDYSHNVVLDLLVWNGIPLGLLLTAACAYWFVTRVLTASKSNAIYAMACLLPILVHSMVEYPFAYSYFLVFAGLMVGIVEASHPDAKSMRINVRWASGVLAIWFALGSYMIYEYLLVEEDFRVVRFENLRVGNTPAAYEVPNIRMLSHMASMLRAMRQEPVRNIRAEDLENLRKASLRFPYGTLSLRYALTLGLNGNPEGATREMAMIRGMFGEHYYRAAVNRLRSLQKEKYPELSLVIAP